jgi:hypothetical protein
MISGGERGSDEAALFLDVDKRLAVIFMYLTTKRSRFCEFMFNGESIG